MPVILPAAAYEEWPHPDTDVGDLLQNYSADDMENWIVGKRVNGPQFDDAEMLNSL